MNDNKKFTSHWGFILACVGSAVGMANVWGFPFRIGSLGGSAFLIPYLIFIILFSYVGLSAEYAIGRRTGTGTVGSYEFAWKKRGFLKTGKVIGWIPLIGSFCIAIGYSVIVAYVLKALFTSITGDLMRVDTAKWFESFALHTYSVIPFHILVVGAVILSLFLGTKGIEKTNKIMMPLFFILFCILAIRIAFLPNALKGYEFTFRPEWKDLLNPKVWIFAMGQAFFSLSITGSGMIVYGAYLPKNEDVINSAKNTAIFDTIAAIVASLVIIPACFSYGVDVNSGPGLLFITLPKILQDIPFGQVFAILLFIAVVFGGISSLQNMLEVVVESVKYKFPKIKRSYIITSLTILLLAISINMEAIFTWGPWMDWVSIYIIPIGAGLGALSWFYILPKEELLDEVNIGSKKKRTKVWYSVGRYIYVPITLLLCGIALFMRISF